MQHGIRLRQKLGSQDGPRGTGPQVRNPQQPVAALLARLRPPLTSSCCMPFVHRFPAVTRLSLDLSVQGEALNVNSCLQALAPFRHLQHLQLRGLALTDAALPELTAAGLPRLESIDMRGCSKVTTTSVATHVPWHVI